MTNETIVLAAAACDIALATSASAMPLNSPERQQRRSSSNGMRRVWTLLAGNESGRGHRPRGDSRLGGA